VFIAGGGPFGLMLANELGRRAIAVVLVDQKRGTTENVQANATQARTMEHYRRLGFADEVRALGMPPDFPTDIAYFTRFAKHELARFAAVAQLSLEQFQDQFEFLVRDEPPPLDLVAPAPPPGDAAPNNSTVAGPPQRSIHEAP